MSHINKYYYVLMAIGIVILLSNCGSDYQKNDVPIETPGAIDKVAPETSLKEMTVVDWRFDPDRILFLKGVAGEPYVTPHDLIWMDIKNGRLIPAQVPEYGAIIDCPAQGKNGQVVYGREVLYLYDSQYRVKTPIKAGCFTSFSPSGSKLAFKELGFDSKNNLVIYSIKDGIIEQTIELLPLVGESGDIETGKVGWRTDDQAVYVVYSWLDEQQRMLRSQIREIDLKTLTHRVIYEGMNVADFSWSPDGRLLVLVETDQTINQTILKILQIEDDCEISMMKFPPYSRFVRWSPTGESILMNSPLGLNPYIINVQKVFGATYDLLKCQ